MPLVKKNWFLLGFQSSHKVFWGAIFNMKKEHFLLSAFKIKFLNIPIRAEVSKALFFSADKKK